MGKEITVDVSYDDSLEDVFARYVKRLQQNGVGEEVLFKGEYQPNWAIVQQGESSDKRGFAVKNFLDISVLQLDLTTMDTLLFMTRQRKEHEIFFKKYHRADALETAPAPSGAQQAWSTWRSANEDSYKKLKQPLKAAACLTTMARKMIRGKSWKLEDVEEVDADEDHYHYVIDDSVYCRDVDGSSLSANVSVSYLRCSYAALAPL